MEGGWGLGRERKFCNSNTLFLFSLPGPVLLETYMSTVTSVQWNHTGSIIAFAGTQKFQDGKELCAVQFYNALGEVLMLNY